MEYLRAASRLLFNTSQQKALSPLEYEKKILQTQGLNKGENVFIYDVKLKSLEGHIHTIEAGRDNKPIIVLIHGYGATAVYYYKVIAQLVRKFHVYAFDLYGKGNSARPKFRSYEYEDAVSFFVLAIEEWREKLGIKEFQLAGHSFGGYVSVQYVRIMKPKVTYLHLISPAGFTYLNMEELGMDIEAEHEDDRVTYNSAMFFNFFVDTLKLTPFQIMGFSNKKKILLDFYDPDRLQITKEERWLFSNFYYGVSSKTPSGDKAVGVFLYFGRYSKETPCSPNCRN